VQERITIQITEALKKALQSNDVAVVIDAHHRCVASRGIRDLNSSTVTAEYFGKFLNPETRKEFLEFIRG
jgi:GTP cyclohydrolase I